MSRRKKGRPREAAFLKTARNKKGGFLNQPASFSGKREIMHSDLVDYQGALLGIAYRITGDMESARDVVQDTYVAALKPDNGFGGFSSLKTYLYRIAINKSIDLKRHWKRRLSILSGMLEEPSGTESALLDEIDRKELMRKVLGKVSDEFRIPLILAEVDGMSYAEIAETMHISLNTVRTRIYRAREKLRKELKRMGVAP
jgi:RNA polymerase sigma factor (sigma-70 family)